MTIGVNGACAGAWGPVFGGCCLGFLGGSGRLGAVGRGEGSVLITLCSRFTYCWATGRLGTRTAPRCRHRAARGSGSARARPGPGPPPARAASDLAACPIGPRSAPRSCQVPARSAPGRPQPRAEVPAGARCRGSRRGPSLCSRCSPAPPSLAPNCPVVTVMRTPWPSGICVCIASPRVGCGLAGPDRRISVKGWRMQRAMPCRAAGTGKSRESLGGPQGSSILTGLDRSWRCA